MLWKTAATALALVPGVFGVTHFMVNAKSEALEARLAYLEHEINKGARFTAHDGDLLRSQINHLVLRHERDIDLRRDISDKIRNDDAHLKATQQSLLMRFARIEDKLYAFESQAHDKDFRNAPFDVPLYKYGDWWQQVDWTEHYLQIYKGAH